MLNDDGAAWAKGRGIGRGSLNKLGVGSGMVNFGAGSKEPAIVFPYYHGEERVNYKARSLDGKRFKQEKGGKQRFYNLDFALSGPKNVCYIVEGELDVASFVEAGFSEHEVVSVPGGAPSEESEQPDRLKRYGFVLDALREGFGEVERYVLATDNDDPGRALRADLAKLLGEAKCWFLDWPAEAKDANAMLMRYGGAHLREYVAGFAKPWPIVGLYRFSEIPEPSPLQIWSTGFPEWDGKIALAPRTLSVATGYPGHGKTSLWQQIWTQVARKHDLRVALFSAETSAKPYVRRNLRRAYQASLTGADHDDAWRQTDAFIEEHFLMMAPDEDATYPWLVKNIEAARFRHGCRVICIDPWNYLEDDYEGPETKWIGRCLRELRDATRALDVHIQILAHPAKPAYEARKEAPDLYAISGSAHWFNKPDQGFTIHRPQIVAEDGQRQTEAFLYHRKARVEELGFPCRVPLHYDLSRGVFVAGEVASPTEAC